ncbi:amino acid ABC transporter permease [Halobaculum sp. D14]|uniref:amino acid ABC transporter permease n=1 Tax=Halobaculum sp. D14 TaxID=3421642 RepID=UPI003EC10E5E
MGTSYPDAEAADDGGQQFASDEALRRLSMLVAGIVTLLVLAFLAILFFGRYIIGEQFVDYALLQKLVTPPSGYYTAFFNVIGVVVVSAITSVTAGVFVGLGRVSKTPFTSRISRAYVEFFRGTPLLFQLIAVFYGIPALFGTGNFPISNFAWPAAIIGLTLNHAAYTGEAIRGGIESIPEGQMEAARSLGMGYVQSMREVILPQAWRNAVPAVGNDMIILVKDTSLLTVIAFPELISQWQYTYSDTFDPWTPLVVVGALYLLITVPLSSIVQRAGELTSPGRRGE